MALSPRYRGFSTLKNLNTMGSTFQIRDIEVIKADLMNHIYTAPGERVMMPNFGTRIPLMTFEQVDQVTLDIIEADLRKVVEYDPRVKLIEIAVLALPNNNAIVALVDLLYIELNVTDTLKLEFQTG